MKLTQFQTITIVIFIVLGVLGVLTFAGIIKLGKDDKKVTLAGKVTLWGTVPADTMRPLVDNFNYQNGDLNIVYAGYDAESFNQALLEALAEGKGPDMFLLPDELAKSYLNRIMAISYARYPAATFKSNFAGAGDIFATPSAIIALPIAIDPLVMYYNRSLLNTAGVVYPPTDWNMFADLVPKLTKKDNDNQISQSTVALGHFTNVAHAKDILATLFMQTGNPIVSRDAGGIYQSSLTSNATETGIISALSYYASFANPLGPNYSWHKGLPSSDNAFVAEDVAFYFGYASELPTLVSRNPNLDLHVAEMPQIKNTKTKVTKARVTGVAISAFSKNQELALAVANIMTSGDFVKDFARATGTAPARRDLLASRLADEFMPTIFKSALYAKSWFDPSPEETNSVFRAMVENVLSGVNGVETSVRRASGQLDLLLVK
ncbi:MAG: ABC transporter substrate-binding protein [Candidatus Paceibacteria bacterium]